LKDSDHSLWRPTAERVSSSKELKVMPPQMDCLRQLHRVSSSKELKVHSIVRRSDEHNIRVSSSKELKVFSRRRSIKRSLLRSILKGIERYVNIIETLSHFLFHPQRNWKDNTTNTALRHTGTPFHPQRNWKLFPLSWERR